MLKTVSVMNINWERACHAVNRRMIKNWDGRLKEVQALKRICRSSYVRGSPYNQWNIKSGWRECEKEFGRQLCIRIGGIFKNWTMKVILAIVREVTEQWSGYVPNTEVWVAFWSRDTWCGDKLQQWKMFIWRRMHQRSKYICEITYTIVSKNIFSSSGEKKQLCLSLSR